MPLYAWFCPSCNFTFEKYRGYEDNTKPKCPNCGRKKHIKKKIGAIVVIYKGDGFTRKVSE